MKMEFYKYQGTGNDFILVDNRQENFCNKDAKHIAYLCDRRFGIGADGLILLENDSVLDFKMVYYNSDGNESSMCGNGGRCIVAFAQYLRIIRFETTFRAIDGPHDAKIEDDEIKLKMQDVSSIVKREDHLYLDTGSPHVVKIEKDIENLDVYKAGKEMRNSPVYKEHGTNVNFITKVNDGEYAIRTYERGVENETLSCGTGVTAAAIAIHHMGLTNRTEIQLNTEGGKLRVTFELINNIYQNIWLLGPAVKVYNGTLG